MTIQEIDEQALATAEAIFEASDPLKCYGARMDLSECELQAQLSNLEALLAQAGALIDKGFRMSRRPAIFLTAASAEAVRIQLEASQQLKRGWHDCDQLWSRELKDRAS